jgi:hypothetical protein
LKVETACVILFDLSCNGSSLFTVMQKANILEAIHERRQHGDLPEAKRWVSPSGSDEERPRLCTSDVSRREVRETAWSVERESNVLALKLLNSMR